MKHRHILSVLLAGSIMLLSLTFLLTPRWKLNLLMPAIEYRYLGSDGNSFLDATLLEYERVKAAPRSERLEFFCWVASYAAGFDAGHRYALARLIAADLGDTFVWDMRRRLEDGAVSSADRAALGRFVDDVEVLNRVRSK